MVGMYSFRDSILIWERNILSRRMKTRRILPTAVFGFTCLKLLRIHTANIGVHPPGTPTFAGDRSWRGIRIKFSSFQITFASYLPQTLSAYFPYSEKKNEM
jgi:hypothetical protein